MPLRNDMVKYWLFWVVTTHNTQHFPYFHMDGEVYFIDKLKLWLSVFVSIPWFCAMYQVCHSERSETESKILRAWMTFTVKLVRRSFDSYLLWFDCHRQSFIQSASLCSIRMTPWFLRVMLMKADGMNWDLKGRGWKYGAEIVADFSFLSKRTGSSSYFWGSGKGTEKIKCAICYIGGARVVGIRQKSIFSYLYKNSYW